MNLSKSSIRFRRAAATATAACGVPGQGHPHGQRPGPRRRRALHFCGTCIRECPQRPKRSARRRKGAKAARKRSPRGRKPCAFFVAAYRPSQRGRVVAALRTLVFPTSQRPPSAPTTWPTPASRPPAAAKNCRTSARPARRWSASSAITAQMVENLVPVVSR